MALWTGELFALDLCALLFNDQHCLPLICPDLIQPNPHTQLQRGPEIDGAADEQPRFRGFRRIEFVQRAMIAPPALVGSIGAQAGIAQFLAAQGPMYEEAERWLLRPLPR